ncbi:transposase from transposon Tn916 [Lachnospiraceae bacterium]|nr:transposase from transposon Tn916 [Lachnospiraceae bacterium]
MNYLTFKELAEEWLHYKKNLVKESTYCNYAIQLKNHIIPLFGNMNCSMITSDILNQKMSQWFENNRLQGNMPLSDKTARDITLIFKLCLNYGMQKNYIPNQKINLVIPVCKNRTVAAQTYTIREQQIIVNAILSNLTNKSNGILISLYTGIRIGELCALRWSDIDLENRTIIISKTLQRLYFKEEIEEKHTKISITSPKTCNSIREVPISSKLTQTLIKLHANNPNTYVLTNTEKYIEPRTYRNFYSQFMDSLDIRKLNFHCLRHTFATRCIECGADYKTVSEILGHANVNITMNLYVHPSIEQKRKCVELIDRINK